MKNMNWNSIHLIKGDYVNVVYCPSTCDIIVINDVTFQMLSLLKSGKSITEIGNMFGFENEINTLVESINKRLNDRIEIEETIKKIKKYIYRITLHVSNDCNLRCKYCFAEGGGYNQPRGIMTIQTAAFFVDFCAKTFDKIDLIIFFGGEPMLNISIMNFICFEFNKLYDLKKIAFIPEFGIITNGTILTNKSLAFLKKYISYITVSVDGPKEINDINRVYINGRGSYSKISKFINTIKRETKINIQYEATFTKSHVDANYSHADITNDLRSEFNIEGIVVDEKDFDPNHILSYWNSIDYENIVKADFMEMPVDFWKVLRAIVKKRTLQICPVVSDIFAIGIDGTIYPCHMLNGLEENSLGNINGVNIFNSQSSFDELYLKFNFKNNNKCKNCWAINVCGGCAVQRFYNEKDQRFENEPNNDFCKLTQKHVEQLLLMIAIIRINPSIWSMFVEKIKK